MIEQRICQAIDHWVDEKDVEQEVFDIIDDIKALLKEGKTGLLYWQWGQCLEILNEYEQSSLRFEEAIRLDPDNKDYLWSLVSLLLYSLQTPEPAVSILQEKLIPLDPTNEQYLDALAAGKKSISPDERAT